MSRKKEKSGKTNQIKLFNKISTRLSLIISIGVGLLIIVIVGAGVVAALTMSFNIYHKKTDQTVRMVSTLIDGEFIGDLKKRLNSPSFQEIKRIPYGEDREEAVKRWLKNNRFLDKFEHTTKVLRDTKETMGVEYIYITSISGELAMDIIDPDDPYNSLGYQTILMKEFISRGINTNEPVEPVITNGKYGWLSSGGYPIYDDDRKAVAIVFVDNSVMDIISSIEIFVIILIALSLVFVLVIVVFILKYVNNRVAKPLEDLTDEVDRFANSEEYDQDSINELDINTRDEIELLYNSTHKMQVNLIEYMENLTLITAEKERIGAELNVATQIQADMLPRIFPAFPERTDFDLYASMVPAKEVGGDFYDFYKIDEDHLALVMADVSGKGVPAALFMVIAKTLIKNKAYMGGSPSEILEFANNQLCEGNEAELFVTVWMAIIDLNTGDGMAVNAGHEHPVIRRAGGEYELVVYKHSPALAVMEGMKFREHEFHLDPGDSIFVYTDGVPEATNRNDELMGTDRMLAALNKEPDAPPKIILENVNEAIEEFVDGAEQFDDTTMMSFVYYGADGNMTTGDGLEENMGEKELKITAKTENLDQVLGFIEGILEAAGCPMKTMMQIDVAVEELFVNIANYAYGDEEGDATIKVETDEEAKTARITFIDSGSPYNPLKKPDPDVTLSAEKRKIGGLGIFMVKKSMDDMIYEYKNDENHLTIVKSF